MMHNIRVRGLSVCDWAKADGKENNKQKNEESLVTRNYDDGDGDDENIT